MANIPITYNIRNLRVRWRSTVMTALSIALVVAVFVIIMSMAQGLKQSFVSTGEPLNIMVLRQGSTSEITSFVLKDTYRIIKYLHGIRPGPNGEPLVAGELTVLMNLTKKSDNHGTNVIIRGISPDSFILHSRVKIVAGRIFQPGLREIIVSQAVARRYYHTNVGDRIHIGKGMWTVVGHFDANKTAFDSEIWGDVNEVATDYDRGTFSSVLIRARDIDSQQYLIKQISNDPRLNLKARAEPDYYKEATQSAVPIQLLGTFLAVTMVLGSIFAAINTMYASVAYRTREIGTLRVLGFTPKNILLSFMMESAILSLIGGIIGCLISLPMDGIATGTVNFQTFSDIAFNFRITSGLLLKGMIFSLIIGILGGLLPSINAARRPVIAALREIE